MPPLTSQLYRQITQISLTGWYVICVAVLLGTWLLFRLACRCGREIGRLRRVISVKRTLYSQVPALLAWFDIATYLDGLMVAILVTANTLPLVLWSRSWTTVQRRAARLAVINLVPLWTGLTFGLPADLLGINRATMVWSHRWLGRMVAFHALFHGAIIVATADNPKQRITDASVALTAAGAIFLIIPLSLHAVVQRYPQIVKAHYSLAVVAMCALAYHVQRRQSPFVWYLVGSVGLWIALSATAAVHAILVKKRWGYPWPKLKTELCRELLHLEITVPSHWTIQPGQYVYVWLPHAGFPAFWQLGLFYVAFWEDTDQQRILHVLTRPQKSSFSMQLYNMQLSAMQLYAMQLPAMQHDTRSSVKGKEQPAFVLGPYGRPFHFPMAGTILFIVEDTGIVRVLPLIRMLVQASEQRQVMVRKLEIVWQMDHFNNQLWVSSWMQQLLDLDGDEFKILQFSLFYRSPSRFNVPPDLLGERIRLFPGMMDAKETVQGHLDNHRGKMVVGVCARPSIRNRIHSIIEPKVSSDLQLVDLPIEPYHVWLNPSDELSEAGGISEDYNLQWIKSKIAEGNVTFR